MPGFAVREYRTDVGPADYVLFVDGKPVGVIEAKREEEGDTLSTHEDQAEGYAGARLKYLNNEKLPFVYISTGTITKITDFRDPKPRARTVFSFHRPETIMGDPPGDCAIYPTSFPEAIITADCIKFRINEKIANIKFVFYSLKTVAVKNQFGLITKGVAQKKMSAQRFRNIHLPLPSTLAEQQAIVSEIETRLSVCDKLEESITQSLVQAEALRQSILKKAFAGRLVPQDPNDEPAGVLLERIRAERGSVVAKKATGANKNGRGKRNGK